MRELPEIVSYEMFVTNTQFAGWALGVDKEGNHFLLTPEFGWVPVISEAKIDELFERAETINANLDRKLKVKLPMMALCAVSVLYTVVDLFINFIN